MKLKAVCASTWFAIVIAGCSLNPIGEDPGVNRDSNDTTAAGEGSPSDDAFVPSQESPSNAGEPIAGPGISPGAPAPETPPIIDEVDGAEPGDLITSEPEGPPGEPSALPGAPLDGGVPFSDAGDAAVPSGAR